MYVESEKRNADVDKFGEVFKASNVEEATLETFEVTRRLYRNFCMKIVVEPIQR